MEISDRDTTAQGPQTPWIAVVAQWRKGLTRVPLPYTQAVELSGGRTKVLSAFEMPASNPFPRSSRCSRSSTRTARPSSTGRRACSSRAAATSTRELYGCPRHPRTHNVSHRRDRFELSLLARALGTRHAGAGDMPRDAVAERVFRGPPRAAPARRSRSPRARPRYASCRTGSRPAHQRRKPFPGPGRSALDPRQLTSPPGLDGVAGRWKRLVGPRTACSRRSYRDHSWVVGVQWHPEAMVHTDHHQRRLFEAFVTATKAYEARTGALTAARRSA